MKLQYILEGGATFSNMHRIERKDIKPTVKQIAKLFRGLGIKEKDIMMLGSTGRKADSGDLDLGIDINQLKKKWGKDLTRMEVMRKLADYLEPKVSDISRAALGISVVNFPFPIYTLKGPTDNMVQVDIMVGHGEAMKFKFDAGYGMEMDVDPKLKTRYKGVHRMLLLAAVLYALKREIDDNTFAKYSIKDDGIWVDVNSWIGKSGRPVKTARRLGSAKVTDKNFRKFFSDLLQVKLTDADMLTFENLWPKVKKSKVTKNKLRTIKKHFKSGLDAQGLEVPKEISS